MDWGYMADGSWRPPPGVKSKCDSGLLALGILFFSVLGGGLAIFHLTDPGVAARRAGERSETHQRVAATLRKEAVAALPPDATDVEVTREDWPTGWLTFVRVESGKRVKFLVCYTRNQTTGEMALSISRAD